MWEKGGSFIEVVGLVGALPGPEKGYPDHVADDLFQRLAVLLVHRQQEKGQHNEHHAQGGGTVPGLTAVLLY